MTSHREIRDLEDMLERGPQAAPSAAVTEYAAFDAYCDAVERLLLIESIDGHEGRDGFSLDSVYSAWTARFTPEEYAAGKRANPPRDAQTT